MFNHHCLTTHASNDNTQVGKVRKKPNGVCAVCCCWTRQYAAFLALVLDEMVLFNNVCGMVFSLTMCLYQFKHIWVENVTLLCVCVECGPIIVVFFGH